MVTSCFTSHELFVYEERKMQFKKRERKMQFKKRERNAKLFNYMQNKKHKRGFSMLC
jgi:hypothetical protein